MYVAHLRHKLGVRRQWRTNEGSTTRDTQGAMMRGYDGADA